MIRAVSEGSDPGGPYSKAETVLAPFHHNPTITGPTPDGYYLMFFIGANNASNEIDCREKIPDVPFHPKPPIPSNGYITMAWTKDPVRGPWKERVVLRDNTPGQRNASSWHCIQNNPAPSVMKNGTVALVFRANNCLGGGEQLGVAIAPHWSADFKTEPNPIVTDAGGTNNEDPFLFTLPDGSWHIVAHQQGKGNLCGDYPKEAPGHSCGAHFYARDPRGPWKMSPHAVYSANVTLANGTFAQFQTRQRPQLVFADDGFTPRYLFTSGSFEGNNPDLNMTTHTYAARFRRRG